MSKSTKLIFCAEDDPDDFELFCQSATAIDPDVEVVHANNGKILLQKLAQTHRIPCLIILDMNMPIMSGKDTLIALKQDGRWKNVPVIIYTTSPRSINYELQNEYDVEVVQKPPNYKHIMETVKHMLNFCAVV